jgi:hypothetical protein
MGSIDASQPRQTKTKPAAAAYRQRSINGQSAVKPSAAAKQVATKNGFYC